VIRLRVNSINRRLLPTSTAVKQVFSDQISGSGKSLIACCNWARFGINLVAVLREAVDVELLERRWGNCGIQAWLWGEWESLKQKH